jgi:hypothetical protein
VSFRYEAPDKSSISVNTFQLLINRTMCLIVTARLSFTDLNQFHLPETKVWYSFEDRGCRIIICIIALPVTEREANI